MNQETNKSSGNEPNDQAHRRAAGENATAQSEETSIAPNADAPQVAACSVQHSCSAWSEKAHDNGLISFAMGESFGGVSANKEKIAWLKKFMES